jgi:hypothetical protein
MLDFSNFLSSVTRIFDVLYECNAATEAKVQEILLDPLQAGLQC